MRTRSLDRLAKGLVWLTTAICCVFTASQSFAQIAHTLTVDVTKTSNLYTYTYTLANSPLSSLPVNVFFVDVARGRDVVVGELADANENGIIDAVDQSVGILSLDGAADDWIGEYQPFEVIRSEDGLKVLGVQLDENNVPKPNQAEEVAFVSGDGINCTNSPNDILPGQNLEFTVQSEYAPMERPYLVLKVRDGAKPCDVFQGFGEGMVMVPWEPPDRETLPCDFDGDGDCDLVDINTLGDAIVDGSVADRFDLNNDTSVDQGDITAFLVNPNVNRINGDLDFSGVVNFDDFLGLAANFGLDQQHWSDGDLLVNGSVDFDDFLALATNFGRDAGGAATASVPEPSGWLLGVTCLLLLHRLRRRS